MCCCVQIFERKFIFYVGSADKRLDEKIRQISPNLLLYSIGLSPPRESLMRFSRYQIR